MNVYILVGMPGVGKTKIGFGLSKLVGYNFIDTDRLIEDTYNQLYLNSDRHLALDEIVDIVGEEEFKKLEEKVILDLTPITDIIIATGGSVIYSDKSIAKLRSIGRVIYLKDSTTNIFSRIKNLKSRGVIGFREGMTFADLHQERARLYKKTAHFTFNRESLNKDEVIAELKKVIIN